MNQSSDPEAGQAYTRASVEAYLRAAASERARIEAAIAVARARTARARQIGEGLDGSAGAGSGPTADGGDPGPVDGTREHIRSPVIDSPDSLTGEVPIGLDDRSATWREPDLPAAVASD